MNTNNPRHLSWNRRVRYQKTYLLAPSPSAPCSREPSARPPGTHTLSFALALFLPGIIFPKYSRNSLLFLVCLYSNAIFSTKTSLETLFITEANTVSLLCFIFLHISLGYSSVLYVSLIQGQGHLSLLYLKHLE